MNFQNSMVTTIEGISHDCNDIAYQREILQSEIIYLATNTPSASDCCRSSTYHYFFGSIGICFATVREIVFPNCTVICPGLVMRLPLCTNLVRLSAPWGVSSQWRDVDVIPIVKACSKLQVLEIQGASITDLTLDALCTCTERLYALNIYSSREVTESAIRRVVECSKYLHTVTVNPRVVSQKYYEQLRRRYSGA